MITTTYFLPFCGVIKCVLRLARKIFRTDQHKHILNKKNRFILGMGVPVFH